MFYYSELYFILILVIYSHSGQNSIAELQQKLSQLTTQHPSQVATQEVVNHVRNSILTIIFSFNNFKSDVFEFLTVKFKFQFKKFKIYSAVKFKIFPKDN